MEFLLLSVVSAHLLGRDLVCRCPHVDLLVGVHAGDDEEDPRAPGSSGEEAAQPEDYRPFIFLDNLTRNRDYL